MIRATRTLFALLSLAVVTACSTPAPSKFVGYSGQPVTQVVVNKGDRRMYLLHNQEILKAYDIDLGNRPVGPKRIEGDGRTPEGMYLMDRFNPKSSFHLSVGVSYPNTNDALNAEMLGASPGGDIFIHGKGAMGRKLNRKDWTAGCIAVEDAEIEEIYAMLRPGVPIQINP